MTELFRQSSSIKCVHCQSPATGHCGDQKYTHVGHWSSNVVDWNEVGAKDGLSYTFCRKIIYPIRTDGRKLRSCDFLQDPTKSPINDTCFKRSDDGMIYCGCNTDECNGGHVSLSMPSFIILNVIVLLVGSFMKT